nr:CorA family divalent cation transporter [Demequina litorisediminis]
MRDALAQILSVNATLVGQRQNSAMQKISGWAAIGLAPTLVAGIYGMNFDSMPELHWAFGYPLALCLMVGLSATLYAVFKKHKWM